MTRTFLLLHSPLLGPGAWGPLSAQLRAQGHTVRVPDCRRALLERPPLYFRIADAAAAIEPHAATPITLIAHSGAGALVPAIARRNAHIAAAIFVDAILPHPGKPWFDVAPPALAARLRAQARGGTLPRWHRWWPKEALEALLPGEAMRDALIAELIEPPLAYFEEAAPLGDIPSTVECAYLQLSDAYDSEAEAAAKRGWRVARLSLHHLAMLTHPAEIATALTALLAPPT